MFHRLEEDIDMNWVVIIMPAGLVACSAPSSGRDAQTAGTKPDVASTAVVECPTCPSCPVPPPCPACAKTDAVFYWVKIRFERGRNPVDLKGTITLHTTDGWFDVATAFTDAIDAENLQPVARQFPHGDALIRHVRAQPDNVGAVTIEDVQYFQEHRTITTFVWTPPDGGGSDRVLMHGTFRLLE